MSMCVCEQAKRKNIQDKRYHNRVDGFISDTVEHVPSPSLPTFLPYFCALFTARVNHP